MKELVLNNVGSLLDGKPFLQSIHLNMDRGERLCLLGPSGCGKTTLLRIIAGLEPPCQGTVIFRGRSIAHLPSHRRNFGMMFQEFALFPHRNVFDNVAFGLEMRGTGRRRIHHRVMEMLELVGLSFHGKRQVTELSGGERQRVALARALAPEPDLILLDEPLGALDRLLRERLLNDLCTILDTTRMTTIMVTHDQQEAFAVAHQICVMGNGRVSQSGSAYQVYNHPESRTVADFLGFQNILDVRVCHDKEGILVDPQGDFRLSLPDVLKQEKEGTKVTLLILPDGAGWRPGGDGADNGVGCHDAHSDGINEISGEVANIFFQGSLARVRFCSRKGRQFLFDMPVRRVPLPEQGRKIVLTIDPGSLRILKA